MAYIAGVPVYTKFLGLNRFGTDARFKLDRPVTSIFNNESTRKAEETLNKRDIVDYFTSVAEAENVDTTAQKALLAVLLEGYVGLGGTPDELKAKVGKSAARFVAAPQVRARRSIAVGQPR
ncbi:MAG: hypothetical protein KGQ41_07385 [Alphaproteobacteria bacterium]|nr:hypothetical protein [Alphaproteobacteria bacterium]